MKQVIVWGALASLVGLAACSKSTENSLVYVTVKAAPAMPAVTQLRVSLGNAGATDVELFPATNTSTPLTFDTSFVLNLPKARNGLLDLTVAALDASGNEVASGSKSVPIVVGGRADATVQLVRGNASDAGASDDGGGGDTRTGGVDGSAVADLATGSGGSGDSIGGQDGSAADSVTLDLPVGVSDAPVADGAANGGAGGSGGVIGTGGIMASGGTGGAGTGGDGGSLPDGPGPGVEPNPEPGAEPRAEPASEPGPEPGPEVPDAALADAPVSQPDTGPLTWVDRSPTPLPASWPVVRSELAIAYDFSRNLVVMFGGWRGGTNYRLSETWEWNGSAAIWTNRTPATLPSSWPLEMVGPAMAYDGHNKMFLFGGFASSVAWLDGAWEWDGANGTWTNRTPAALPSAWPARRAWFNLAYDSARDVVFLFGGSTPNGLTNDTWEWNPVTKAWTNRTPATLPAAWPSGRDDYGMAYDSTRGRVVVFGGTTDAGPSAETWEWNGTTGTWLNRTPASLPTSWPAARTQLAMAYDPHRGKVVIFGGNQGRSGGTVTSFQETWEWDGAEGTWTNRTPSTLPAAWPEARSQHAMVYDPASSGTVMFGGGDYVAIRFPSANTWEWMTPVSAAP